MAVVALFSLFAIIALFVHLVSGEKDGARQGLVDLVTKRLPLQSIKIIVVVWQILTQVKDIRCTESFKVVELKTSKSGRGSKHDIVLAPPPLRSSLET